MSPDIKLLIHCCNAQPTAADLTVVENALNNNNTDHWQKLLDLAMFHGIFPSVSYFLQHHTAEHIKAPLQAILSRYDLDTTRQSLMMTAELFQLNAAFKALGVTTLNFKGPALAKVAYGSINQRQFYDLDIFIQRQDFRKVLPIMQARGYTPFFPLEKYPYNKVLFELNNDCPFYRSENYMAVELHWDFFRKLALPTAKFKPWQQVEKINIKHHEVLTLRNETHLLYHALHGSKHIWERLIWVLDIDRFIRAQPGLNWDEMRQIARNMGADIMFLLGPALANKYFHTPLPENIKKACQQAKFEKIMAFIDKELDKPEPTPETSLVKLVKVIGLRDNLYYKTRTLIEFMFRPGINERRTIVLPDQLFWLYWFIRPVGAIFRFVFCRLLHLCKKQKT